MSKQIACPYEKVHEVKNYDNYNKKMLNWSKRKKCRWWGNRMNEHKTKESLNLITVNDLTLIYNKSDVTLLAEIFEKSVETF